MEKFKIKKQTLAILCIPFLMGSCSNEKILTEEENLIIQEQKLLTEEENQDIDTLLSDGEYSFIFDNNKYTYKLEDERIQCDNKTKEILDYLQKFGESLITVVNEKQEIEYFTSEESYKKRYLRTRANDVAYRATYVTLYRNKNHWGSREHYHFDSRNGITQTNTGVSWGVSSLKGRIEHVTAPLLAVVEVEFFEQNDFKGRNLKYRVENKELSVSNLKDVPLYPGSKENWNDRIKSLKVF